MALLWIEGFESFGVTNGNAPVGLKQKYDNATDDSSIGSVQAGRTSGHSLRMIGGGTILGKTISTGTSTLIVGFGFYIDAFSSNANGQIFQFWDGASEQGALELQTSGLWKYYRRNNSTTALGTSSGIAITTATWFYVELKVTFHSSAGTVDIWVNGTSVLSLTGQNTSNSGNAQATTVVWEGSLGGSDHTTFDDIYVLDTTGSLNNAVLGAQVVKMIVPASDAGTNAYTPDSGTNHWDRLTENPQDTTTYLSDDTTGHRELFGMGSLAIGSVLGLQVNLVAAVTDNTVYSIKHSSHTSGGTDTDQAAVTTGDANYQTVSNVMQTNPQTSAQWAVSEVNAAQFGFKTG